VRYWRPIDRKLHSKPKSITELKQALQVIRDRQQATGTNEKALRETQTLRAGKNAEPKIFAPPQTPFGGRRTAKIQADGDGHYLHLQTQFGENRCTQFRVIVVTDTARPLQTHRQDR